MKSFHNCLIGFRYVYTIGHCWGVPDCRKQLRIRANEAIAEGCDPPGGTSASGTARRNCPANFAAKQIARSKQLAHLCHGKNHRSNCVVKPPNILILESEPGHATKLVAELHRQRIQFASVKVEHRDSFLRALDDEHSDLILAEYTVPSGNAFADLEAVHEQHPEVPFVILTASCDPGLLIEIFECGAAGHVRRQQPDELAPIIRLALENAQQLRPPIEVEILQEDPMRPDRPAYLKVSPSPTIQPVCPRCKRIADPLGQWERLDTYLRLHHQATVTLGTCPDCAAEYSGSKTNSRARQIVSRNF